MKEINLSKNVFMFVQKIAGQNGKSEKLPVKFIGNVWQIADSFADATFFETKEKALKKQKYATFCDIVEVELSMKYI